MKDLDRLKDLILERVDLADVMIKYGVTFAFNPKIVDRVQYRCPFHGKDNKPSARIYRDTKSCYCWVCMKTWNVITFIQEKESLGYKDALMFIINRYGLDISSIPDDPKLTQKKTPKVSAVNVHLLSMEKRIKELKNKIEFDKYSILVSFYLMIKFDVYREQNVAESIIKLESKLDSMEEALQCR